MAGVTFKNNIYVDRRIFDKKGKWLNPRDKDLPQNIFYFIKEPMTMVEDFEGGRETVRQECTITIFGGKPVAKGDKVVLATGEQFTIKDITPNYYEHNVLVVDMLKQRIASMDLVLR